MSVIGPRPQLVRDLVFMSKEERKRHTVKPGLHNIEVNKKKIVIMGYPIVAHSLDELSNNKLTSHEERLSTSLITPILLPSGECLAVVVYIR